MPCSTTKILSVALVGLLLVLSTSVPSWGVNDQPIGSITRIEGKVSLAHEGDMAGFKAMLGDEIFLYDHIWTEQGRVQILFTDESLLNLAENTYIQITEHIYSPEKNWRSCLFRIVGKVRAIVGRYFPGAGSRYEIHTPTAIIGVRGTHFFVDATFTDETTVVCLDTSRDLAVRNIRDDVAGEVILTGGLMTKVLEGQPPTPPAPAPKDLMMRLLMDTQVMPPTLQGGPEELRGLSLMGLPEKEATKTLPLFGQEIAITRPVVKMPPIPAAPDEPSTSSAVRPLPPTTLPPQEEPLPPPPAPPTQ
jgi:hypothetical protein